LISEGGLKKSQRNLYTYNVICNSNFSILRPNNLGSNFLISIGKFLSFQNKLEELDLNLASYSTISYKTFSL
jgi:hypothetical protein